MDIKLGTTLYDPTDPGVTEAKRLKMEEKARSRSSEKTGMAITGFQTWDPTSQAYVPRSRQDCGKLQPEELGQAFADYWSMGGTTTSIPNRFPNSATQDAQMDDVAGDADGDQADSVEPTSNSITQPPPNISTPTKPTHPDPHARDMIRSLHALQKTLERFHALISHLEIRFIGASLLIIYEGDPARLRRAWRLVDRGESRGDGLQDEDCLVEEDDFSDIERDEADGLDDAGNAVPQKGKSSKSFFAQIFGGFGAERNDGSQGFGLLDGTPPPSPRPRQRSRSHITLPDAQNVIECDGEESECDDSDDEERIPDEDAKDRIPRPFTLRLIDFAHTRLADGEGPDVGFLQGVKSVMALVQGRIRELEVEQGVSDE
ncbi:hypothetical protein QFC21_004095 [Naganishia friedmannii]|uniref:Uncharacterized protein n=1 Tax=Naganishia friedmannii TaxID=89922 RepID=A0ACC2VJF5_9TREE|nr:hypothetical protein QFC21_004095 [Naganishia friedmannii]